MKYFKVIVYATTTCPYCTMIADWLVAKNVQFEKVMVDENQQAAIDMVRKTGQMGVPVTEIQYQDRNPEFVIGFNPPQLGYMLGIS